MALLTAAALVVLLQLTAAAAADGAPPIGLPGCITSCGTVSVPYPFGIQPGCYRPGFNLTCDTSRPGSPRLLLGDGSLRVVGIFIENATVRVLRDGPMLNASGGGSLSIEFASFFAGGHYRVSYYNELILFGCNVEAGLVAGKIRPAGGSSPMVQLCNTFCGPATYGNREYCDGTFCCQSHYSSYDWYHMPTELRLRPHEGKNNSDDDVLLFLAELDWFNNWNQDPINNGKAPDLLGNDIPLTLRWDIMQGLALPKSQENRSPYINSSLDECPRDVASLCKSNKSECTYDLEVYMCSCKEGYEGNPYVDGGCQDMDECKHPQDSGCFGDCTNTDGWFECQCPSGTFGNPVIPGGCFETADSSKDWPLEMPGMAPLRIGLPQCETSCGRVHVPYPFGFGPNRCYLPGFDLTCDKGHKPPRLFLNNTLQVVGIFLNDSTMRVIHTKSFRSYQLNFPDIGEPYMLSARNEFISFACNFTAELHGEYGNSTSGIISGCVSTCTSGRIKDSVNGPAPRHSTNTESCFGSDGCCHADVRPGSRPNKLVMWKISNVSHTLRLPPMAFVAEKGQIDQWSKIFNKSNAYYFTRLNYSMRLTQYEDARDHRASEVPLVLQWELKQNVSPSAQSDCWRKNGSYTCYCKNGFYGNPYLVDGCHDIDECKISENLNKCFGDCKNLYGSYECRCPRGTYGDPYKRGGCTKYLTGSTIGLLAASGPAFLLLVLGVSLAVHKVKQHRKRLQRLKYFKQNRGQLLQQLVSHRADIAERMIIPINELAKATNNFDRARELGGGGHGTVYKGILSDLQVVAIKKSNRMIQREINEFINEVAILSQINHRNVVKLIGCCLETEVPLLVYEFVSNGTLHNHLHMEDRETRSLTWRERLRIACETAKAIAYLHSSISIPIIHRDIKSPNILLDDALTAKVSDFGASRYNPTNQNEASTTAVQGTYGYMDPLYYYTRQMASMNDVYSLGVVLIELLTRQIPTSYRSEEGNGGLVAEFNVLIGEGNLIKILDPQVVAEGGTEIEEVAALAASCTKYTGEERPTMRQVEMALEALQATNDQGLNNVVEENSEGNNARSHIERRTNSKDGTRQYSLEQEFFMSASYPR